MRESRRHVGGDNPVWARTGGVPVVIADTAHLGRALDLPTARQIGRGIAFLSLGAVVAGCFLPVAAEGSVEFDRIEGNSLWPSGIGWLTLALCGLVAFTLLRSLHRGTPTWGALIRRRYTDELRYFIAWAAEAR